MQTETQSNEINTPKSDDGYVVGQSAASKVGMHGTAGTIQRTGSAQAAVAVTGATNSTPYGFTTAAQADALVTLVNELRAALVAKGMIAGA